MDGDTIEVQSFGRKEKVRLAGIDAPEYNQPYGLVARNALSALVKQHTVRIIPTDRDAYGRVVARIYVRSIDVNLTLVRRGYAWTYRRYTQDSKLEAAEKEARAVRRGLWTQRKPVPPWKWRRKERAKEKEHRYFR